MVSSANNEWGGMTGICPACSLSIWDLYGGYNWSGGVDPEFDGNDRMFQQITTALEQGVRAINGSYGSGNTTFYQDIQDAFQFAWENNLIMVFSAGNCESPSRCDHATFSEIIVIMIIIYV